MSAYHAMLRATLGSLAANIPDSELDNYAHDLILAETMTKKKRYNDFGVEAYLNDEPK